MHHVNGASLSGGSTLKEIEQVPRPLSHAEWSCGGGSPEIPQRLCCFRPTTSRCHWIRVATWRQCWEFSRLLCLLDICIEARVQDTAKFKLLVQKLKSRRPMNWFVSVFWMTVTAFRRGSDSHQLIAGIWVLWASCWVNGTEEHEKAALHRSSAGLREGVKGVSGPCLLSRGGFARTPQASKNRAENAKNGQGQPRTSFFLGGP